jgi:hypothetical protein
VAVCNHQLGVEEACERYGLTLEDFLDYLATIRFEGLPPTHKREDHHAKKLEAEEQTDTEEQTDLGKRLDRTI